MGALILPSRLTRQPQGVARVARRWASFASATVFNANRDIATGARLSSTQTALPSGIGGTVFLGSGQAIPLGLAVTSSWSLLMVLRRDAETSYPYFLGVLNGGAYKYALAGKNDTIGQRMGWYDGAGFRDSGFSQPLGSTDTIGLTYDGTTNRYSWFKNGKAYNSDIGASNGSGAWQFATIAGETATNTYPLLSIVPRAVPAADMLALTANPWQLFDAGSSAAYLTAIASTTPSTPPGASVTLPSAAASSAAGTIVASGGASAAIVGAAASAAAGAIVASGTATVTITGAASTAQAGTITASGAGNAMMPSAAASSAAGTIIATAGGGASVTLVGAAATSAAGTMTASGAANAAVPSAAAASAAGTLAASGAANVTLPAAVAAAVAGALGAQGGASVSIVGVSGQLQAGSISAQGVFNGDAVAMLVGAAAVASAGIITAVGTRVGIKVNITEDMICKVVRDYILTIASGQRVVRTPVNKASMPVGAYVAFTPGLRMPLATNVSTYDDNGRFTKRSEQMSFQIDCYGEGAADLAETINTLYRDKYAADLFAESGFDIAPLYAGNVMQAPFVNDSDQYEDRYTFEIELQVNSVIEVPQQSCNMLTIELESVDASYPPQEVE